MGSVSTRSPYRPYGWPPRWLRRGTMAMKRSSSVKSPSGSLAGAWPGFGQRDVLMCWAHVIGVILNMRIIIIIICVS